MPYSENVAVYPLNAAGALELGLHPCQYCKTGWGYYSSTALGTCYDNCDWIRLYNEQLNRNTK